MLVQDGKSTKQGICMRDTKKFLVKTLDEKMLQSQQGGVVSISVSSDSKAELESKSLDLWAVYILGIGAWESVTDEPIKQGYKKVWPKTAGHWKLPKVTWGVISKTKEKLKGISQLLK